MKPRLLLDSEGFEITINRLCFELIENHDDFSNSVIIGLQPRGIYLAQRICKKLNDILSKSNIKCGDLDITFFRDDFRRRNEPLLPNITDINFIVEDKRVILIDDVLYTGRTIRAGLDAILAFGRPQKVELLVLIDRRYSRHLPIEPNYAGKHIDTIASQKVNVEWKEIDGKDNVWLADKDYQKKSNSNRDKKING